MRLEKSGLIVCINVKGIECLEITQEEGDHNDEGCDHFASVCRGCAKDYLQHSLADAAAIGPDGARCIGRLGNGDACAGAVPLATVRRILGAGTADFRKYERFVRHAQISADPGNRWCPNPRCGCIVNIRLGIGDADDDGGGDDGSTDALANKKCPHGP